ncbi:hypothetical protein B484DRAFT_217133 [Ochromonadaceae sp. CCMP2298]|nr:hypothetical protein B484DRAFT_217133 [Ochromonadaceae sp. CCMP2298]
MPVALGSSYSLGESLKSHSTYPIMTPSITRGSSKDTLASLDGEGRGGIVSMPAPLTHASSSMSNVSVADQEAESAREAQLSTLAFTEREVVIKSVVIESEQLVHAHYDSVFVSVRVGPKEFETAACLRQEKNSKRRTFNVDWGEMIVAAKAFKEEFAYVTVAVKDETLALSAPLLPLLSTTIIGQSPHSIQIPLYLFFEQSFEVRRELTVHPMLKGRDKEQGRVKLQVQGVSRIPAFHRNSVIMQMRPADLLRVKFIPLEDPEDMSDEESLPSLSSASAHRRKKRAAAGAGLTTEEEEDDLASSLYP